jgi:methanogenic corrinoid protein MtbC1
MVAGLLKILQDRDIELLRDKLKQQLLRLGFRQFVLDVIHPLNTMVGDTWAQGIISVREEHIYTALMQSILYEEIGKLSTPGSAPRVALMTVPDETHILGILMVEAMVLMNGGTCISLGAQIPLDQIVPTVHDYQIDVVGLSFSAAFPKRRMTSLLKTIRQMLPAETALWVGGAGVAGLHKTPKGVIAFNDLSEIDDAVAQFNLETAVDR